MIDELKVIEVCNKVLDQLADGDKDGAIDTISKLRSETQQKVDEFEKWAEEESKNQQEIDAGEANWQDGGVEDFGQN